MSIKQKLASFHPIIPKSVPKHGELEKTPAYILVLWASSQSFTGRFLFQKGERIKHLYFRDGAIENMSSNVVQEEFDKIMLNYDFCSPSEWKEWVSAPSLQEKLSSENWDSLFVSLLNKTSPLTRSQIKTIRELQAQERLLDLLGWFEGQYRMEARNVEKNQANFTRMVVSDFFSSLESFIVHGRPSILPPAAPDAFSPEGNLKEQSALKLLTTLSAYEFSGILNLHKNTRKKQLHFNSGKVGGVASSNPNETLEKVLLRWNYLSETALKKIHQSRKEKKGKLRDVLLEQGQMSESQLNTSLQILHTERLLEVFHWKSGNYTLEGEFLRKEKPSETTDSQSNLLPSLEEKEKYRPQKFPVLIVTHPEVSKEKKLAKKLAHRWLDDSDKKSELSSQDEKFIFCRLGENIEELYKEAILVLPQHLDRPSLEALQNTKEFKEVSWTGFLLEEYV